MTFQQTVVRSLVSTFYLKCGTLLMVLLLQSLTCAQSGTEPVAPAVKTDAKVERTNSLGMKFRELPGTPVLFCIWETRVRDFAAFVKQANYDWSYRTFFPQTDDHPVVNTTLRDAVAFCEWLTRSERAAGLINDQQIYRLPRKEEWDAAVGIFNSRSGGEVTMEQKMKDQQSFPWGTEWPPPPGAGNFNSMEINGTDDHFPFTAPVGSFNPSKDGLFDLAGNAWEWTWEQDGRPEAAVRGGSWMYFRKECLLSAYEYRVPVDTRAPSIGFRVVLEDRALTKRFLLARQKSEQESEKSLRDKIGGKSTVSDAEIARLRAQIAARNAENAPSITLPDAASLKPAQKDKPFINSLGMDFQPLGQGTPLMAAYEVRVQDYEACMKASGKSWTRKPSFDIRPTHPVVNVTWQEAVDFCKWLTGKDRAAKLIGPEDVYRLPTDEEWSLAVGLAHEPGDNPKARHLGNKIDYPWGRDIVPPPRSANIDTSRLANQDEFSYTAPVGSFSPNALHIYDLAGNAAEWCADSWPDAPDERVVRGSSWMTAAPVDQEKLLSSYRQHLPATQTRPDVGFRVVLEIKSR